MADSPFQLTQGRLLVGLKLQPGAGRNAIAGIESLAGERRVVKVKVTAPPEDGKANAAAIALLAKAWELPKSRLAIVAGRTARLKTLEIAEADAALRRRLEAATASV
ncbi:MAG: DUF167 family protein [Rhodovibrionaceae bacterium]